MNKEEFLHKANDKLNAMRYFPEFFEKDCNVSSNKTIEQLNKAYTKACKKYVSFKNFDESNTIRLASAYGYMMSVLGKNKNAYEPKHRTTKDLLSSYDKLIESISRYHFNPEYDNSYGDNQNKANKQMLFEISLLRPMLIMVLENIDDQLEKRGNNNVNFNARLTVKLVDLIEDFFYVNQGLTRAECNYHNMWDRVMKGSCNNRSISYLDVTEYDLGETKLTWKKKKNEACHTILNFHKSMKEINRNLNSYDLNDLRNFIKVNELYVYGIDNIVNGPNYYSYLSDEERKNLDEQNKLRKTLAKNK